MGWVHYNKAVILIAFSTIISIVGVAVAVWWTIFTLWNVPPGSAIRPINSFFVLMMVCLGTAVLGVPSGVVGLFLARRRRGLWLPGLLAITLALLAPALLSRELGLWIMAHHHLVFSGS